MKKCTSNLQARRAGQTRWLYRQEAQTFAFNRWANAERSMGFLRKIAIRVWRTHGNGKRMPAITAGRGTPHGHSLASYCIGFTVIVLARHHRTILVLLHELTHALGPCQHGPRFVKTYFPLLQKYAGYNRIFLQQVAGNRGIMI